MANKGSLLVWTRYCQRAQVRNKTDNSQDTFKKKKIPMIPFLKIKHKI